MPMQSKSEAITLIGMPGVGKSTVGALLAKRLQRIWIDTDTVIERQNGGTLQQVLESGDLAAFRAAEEKAVLSLQLQDMVVSTGGSVVYSDAAMKHLSSQSTVIYLKLDLDTLLQRLGDVSQRGLLRSPGQSIESLLDERSPLYQRWATHEIDCQGMSAEGIAEQISRVLT